MQNDVEHKYQGNLNRAESLLAKLQAHITTMKAEDQPNWADVGSSGHVVDKLQEVVDFLGN